MIASLEYFVIAALALVGLLAAPRLLRQRRRSGSVVTAQRALHDCRHLLQLIGHMQQHRGMSSALLAGDRSFAQRLSAKRREIDALFRPLQQGALDELQHASPCFTPNDLSLFRFKWRSLADGLATMSVDKSIAEHGQLIATALEWLDALGEARVGLAGAGLLPAGLVKNYAYRLPALAECLGQARAIGSSVAARGKCSAVARVRLMFLASRAESLLEQACGVSDDPAGAGARVAVKSLVNLIRERMLAAEQVDVTASTYFSQATKAIEDVFAWVGRYGEILAAKLT